MSADFDSDYALLMAFDGPHTDDRSLAIVFTSYAEKYLVGLIRFRMKGLSSKLDDKLFDRAGLLGPLQAKIDIAKALNILDAVLFNDLKVMGSIRNQFAHNLAISSFDHPEVASRVANLRLTPEANPEQIGPSPPATWSNRDRFRLSARAICATLHGGIGAVTRFRERSTNN